MASSMACPHPKQIEEIDENVIKEGDKVILKKGINMVTVQVKRNKRYYIEKMDFLLEGAIGKPYGCEFETKGIRICPVEPESEDGDIGACEAGKDNRHIQDDSASQKLSREEIEDMRKKGETGEKVVKQLIENSATFKGKTEFSQQKYIKKKNKKHLNRLKILRPSTRLIAEMYFNKGPAKINYLRIDSLSQMLTIGGIKAHTRQLVVESCNGLLMAAVVERMGGFGTVVQLHSGQDPPRQAMEGYNFTEEHHKTMHSFPLRLLSTLHQTGLADSTNSTLEGTASLREKTEDQETICVKKARLETEPDLEPNETAPKTEDTMDLSTVEVNSKDPTTVMEVGPQDGDSMPLETLNLTKIDQDERKITRLKQLEVSRTILQEGNFDGLLVATKDHPTPIVLGLIDLVKDSRPVVVFSPYTEPLLDCYMKLRNRKTVALMKLSETWLRNYQVLPNRTHPEVMMSNSSGYLLSFTKVNSDPPEPSTA